MLSSRLDTKTEYQAVQKIALDTKLLPLNYIQKTISFF